MSASSVPAGVGVLVFDGQGRVLLGERHGSHASGTWCPPGGRIDPPDEHGNVETSLICAGRELAEEAGIVPVGLRPLGLHTNDHFPDDAQQWVTLYFTCRLDGQTPRLMEPHKCRQWRMCDWGAWPGELMAGFAKIAQLDRELVCDPARIAEAIDALVAVEQG